MRFWILTLGFLASTTLVSASDGFRLAEPAEPDEEVFLGCIANEGECKAEGHRRGFHKTVTREDHENCHSTPAMIGCYGVRE